MLRYYGTKLVEAEPGQNNEGIDGYRVVYEDGYESWSPKHIFEASYQRTNAMSFGHAVVAMENGKRVCRAGWNGKGMFVFLVPGSTFKVNRPPLLGIYKEGKEITYGAHIDIKAADDTVRPWLASQDDVLSKDWMIVETIAE